METQNTFLITPMAQSFTLEPGETTTGSITVINSIDSPSDFSYRVYVAPYGVTNESYDVDLITESAQTEIAKWVTISSSEGTLAPNETTDVTFTITVPDNAPGGGQYASIIVQAVPTAESSGSMVESIVEMASIIYANIKGDNIVEGEILDNSVPAFSTIPEISIGATLTNTGNTHGYAKTSFYVTDFFSGEELPGYEEERDPITEVIMPGTTRYLTRTIDGLPSLGVVTVNQTIEYLGQTDITQHQIIICPLWFIALVGATIAALVTVIIARVKGSKKKL